MISHRGSREKMFMTNNDGGQQYDFKCMMYAQ